MLVMPIVGKPAAVGVSQTKYLLPPQRCPSGARQLGTAQLLKAVSTKVAVQM